MHAKFREAVESLQPKFELLKKATPHKEGAWLPMKGVYLFTEKGKPLYVGRSNNIRKRLGHHRRPSSPVGQAAFAVLIVRRDLKLSADYRPGPNALAGLVTNSRFMAAFAAAKERIRKMEFRAVDECDQTRQALLEIYCAVALATPYNSFKNH